MRARRIGLIFLVLCSGVSALFGLILQRTPHGGIVDFKIVYLAARCVIEHRDPYNQGEYLRVFAEQGGVVPSSAADREKFQHAVMAVVYFPTALMLVAPFAALGWAAAQVLWTIFTIGLFTFACYEVWRIAADSSPPLAACLLGLMLTNAEVLFAYGNAAGVAVSLCAIAVCCFVRERWVWAGVLCLAVSLALKPHDAGAVWLLLLVVGGSYRKRALQSALVVCVLCIPAILWVSSISPHWIHELRSNLELVSARGGVADPGPSGISNGTGGAIINLQSAVAVFRDEPQFYSSVAYAICAPLFIAWLVGTVRRRREQIDVWLSMAVLVPLSMLPVYHRPYDTKLLMLAIPGCAALWATGGVRRWFGLIITSVALLLTSDIPVTVLAAVAKRFPAYPVGIWNQLVAVLITRPVPLILLAMSVFYLVVYLRPSYRATA